MVTLTVTRTNRRQLPPVQCIKIQHGHTHCHAYESATVTTSLMYQNTTWSHSLSRERIGGDSYHQFNASKYNMVTLTVTRKDRRRQLPPVQCIKIQHGHTHCHAYESATVTTSSMHQNTTWSHSLSRERIGDSYHQFNASKYNMVTLTVTRTDRRQLPPVQCIKIQHGHTHCHVYGSATVTTSPMHQNTTWSHSLSRVRIGDSYHQFNVSKYNMVTLTVTRKDRRRQLPPVQCIKIQHGHTHCHAYGSATVTTSSMHQNTTWSHSLSRVRIGDSYHQSNASKYNMVTLTVTRTDRRQLPPVQCIKIQHGHTHCHAYGSATVTTSPMHQNTTWSHSLSRVRIGDSSRLLPPVQHIIVYQDYTDIDSQFIFATTHQSKSRIALQVQTGSSHSCYSPIYSSPNHSKSR